MDFHPNIVLKHDIFPQKEMFFYGIRGFLHSSRGLSGNGYEQNGGASLTK